MYFSASSLGSVPTLAALKAGVGFPLGLKRPMLNQRGEQQKIPHVVRLFQQSIFRLVPRLFKVGLNKEGKIYFLLKQKYLLFILIILMITNKILLKLPVSCSYVKGTGNKKLKI